MSSRHLNHRVGPVLQRPRQKKAPQRGRGGAGSYHGYYHGTCHHPLRYCFRSIYRQTHPIQVRKIRQLGRCALAPLRSEGFAGHGRSAGGGPGLEHLGSSRRRAEPSEQSRQDIHLRQRPGGLFQSYRHRLARRLSKHHSPGKEPHGCNLPGDKSGARGC